MGHPVRSFAYPHGYWRTEVQVRRLAGEAGFDTAWTGGYALTSAGKDRLAVARLMVHCGIW